MAALTIQEIGMSGVTPTYSAVNSSDTMKVDDSQRHFLHVKNGGGSSINVTITAVDTNKNVQGVGDVAISNEVVAVTNGSEEMIGPFGEAYINSSGNVTIGYSATTSVTAAALKLPAQY